MTDLKRECFPDSIGCTCNHWYVLVEIRPIMWRSEKRDNREKNLPAHSPCWPRLTVRPSRLDKNKAYSVLPQCQKNFAITENVTMIKKFETDSFIARLVAKNYPEKTRQCCEWGMFHRIDNSNRHYSNQRKLRWIIKVNNTVLAQKRNHAHENCLWNPQCG